MSRLMLVGVFDGARSVTDIADVCIFLLVSVSGVTATGMLPPSLIFSLSRGTDRGVEICSACETTTHCKKLLRKCHCSRF